MIGKEEVIEFSERVQEMIDTHYETSLPNSEPPKVKVDFGRRYARIYTDNGVQCLAHSFVDMSNGDVLKVATWKAPAKHARGNIGDESNGMDAVSVYGAKYLR